MPDRTIVVDLDDTLNDFSATLARTPFSHGGAYAFSEETFQDYLGRVRRDEPEKSGLLSTEYAFFRAKIHLRCYALARPRPDGVDFLRWLRREGWRIVIGTQRDLRRAQDATRRWLAEHGIPFDHLFIVGNKVAFCRLWEIPHLIDDDVFNIEHGARLGLRVYYPILPKHAALPAGHGARGFESFEEIKSWIRA